MADQLPPHTYFADGFDHPPLPVDPSGYKRIVLWSHWDGMIGPSSQVQEVVVLRCQRCRALILCDYVDAGDHDRWHERIEPRG